MRHPRRGRRIRQTAAVAGLALLVGTSALVGAVAAFSYRSATGSGDAAVVLGAAIWGKRPSPVFEARIRHALDLYRAGRVRKILFTGGVGEGDTRAEATVARAYAVARGLPPEDLLCEAISHTTQENLLAARAVLRREGLTRVLLVSDPIARDLGIEAEPSPTPVTRFTGRRARLAFLLRETYFVGAYLVQRLLPADPDPWGGGRDLPACP
jgi:uncharacterized SAM-binding protein YcdF (DUF218 family)